MTVEVVAGPSSGFRYTLHSTNESQLPLTLGRVPPCGLLFNDSEVSGKHAMINWNSSVQMFLLGLVHFFSFHSNFVDLLCCCFLSNYRS